MGRWQKRVGTGATAGYRKGDPDRSGAGSTIRTPPKRGLFARSLLLVALVYSICIGTATAAVEILPLGDSITHGSNAYPSYRPLLYQDLRALGYEIDFVGSVHTPALAAGLDPDNEGHPGYTAGMVLTGLPGWMGAYQPPAIALIHLGTNDVIQYIPKDRTIADIRSIIGVLRARNPEMTILVAQIIPTSVSSTNTRIEALNREIAGLGSLSTPQSPIIIVDQYSGYNGQADNQPGGVHPLTSGEGKMAARWKAALIPVLDRITAPDPPRFGPHVVPGRIEAEDYDIGGYVDTTPGNSGAVYRNDDVDIEYAASEGSYVVGWIRDGESLAYTVNAPVGGPFALNARVASPNDGRRAILAVNGTAAAEIHVPNTGSFDAFQTVTVEVALSAGVQHLTLRFAGDGQNLNWIEFVTNTPMPTLTVPPLPPQDVTGLANATYEPDGITWTWTDPADPGFANVTVCLDGIYAGVVQRGVQSFTATGLGPSTAHTISTRTRNSAGAESVTWTNHSSWTAPAVTSTQTGHPTPPLVPTETPEPVLLPFSSTGDLPRDLDGDGLYEDVNGNGRADFADIVLFFDRMDWIAANQPVPAFDCNGNGRIDFADVIELFAIL